MASFKPKEIVKILKKLGFIEKRQKGSHLIMFDPETKKTIPVPMHAKDIKKGLMKAIIKQSGYTEEEFLKLR